MQHRLSISSAYNILSYGTAVAVGAMDDDGPVRASAPRRHRRRASCDQSPTMATLIVQLSTDCSPSKPVGPRGERWQQVEVSVRPSRATRPTCAGYRLTVHSTSGHRCGAGTYWHFCLIHEGGQFGYSRKG